MRQVLLFDASRMHASKVGLLKNHPLHRCAEKWSGSDHDLQGLVNRMIAVMSSTGAAVVTAPEIGESSQVLVMNGHFVNPEAYNSGHALVMVNPMIVRRSDDLMCRALQSSVSLPPLAVVQLRYAQIEVVFTNLEGRMCRMDYDGAESAAIQLGIDQLSGVTLLDKSINSYNRRLKENRRWMANNKDRYTKDEEGLIWMNV